MNTITKIEAVQYGTAARIHYKDYYNDMEEDWVEFNIEELQEILLWYLGHHRALVLVNDDTE